MTKTKSIYHNFTAFAVALLNAILFICANTNSCAMIHQPVAPQKLDGFSKIK